MTQTPSPPLSRRDLLACCGVVALALAARLFHLWEQADNPLLATPLLDARSYLDWSRQILAGDLASRHQRAFYQAPLYPYFLALVGKLFGPGLGAIRIVQALLGALAAGLVFAAGRRLFGWGAGLVAGVMLALYAPALFNEALLQKEALATFLAASVLLLLVWAAQGSGSSTVVGLGRWLELGVVLGLFALLRENALLLVPALGLGLLLRPRLEPERPGGWRPAGALVLGAALVLAPVVVRNRLVAGEWLLTTAQAGPNFYIGNHAGASGTYQPLSPGRSDVSFERRDARVLAEAALGRELSAREVSRYWWGRGLAFVRAEPLAWLRLTATKVWMVLHRYELADTESLALYARTSPWLAGLAKWVHFGLLLPLAAAGVAFTRRRWRELLPIYLVASFFALGVALFFVFGRYRLPLAAWLACFAGVAVVEGWSCLRRRQWRALGLPLGVAILVALLVNWPTPKAWSAGEDMGLVNLGVALASAGRYDEALAAYAEALERSPSLIEGQLNRGNLLLVLGRTREAMPHLLNAARLAPGDGEPLFQLGHAHRALGDRRAARAAFEAGLVLARRAKDRDLESRLLEALRAEAP